MILILMVDGAKAVISFCILSAIPGYMVVPPDMTVLAYKSLRMSTSHFMMELYVVSWTPQDSIPKKDGWKRASGARKRSIANGDDLSIGQFVGFFQGGGGSCGGHFLFEVKG